MEKSSPANNNWTIAVCVLLLSLTISCSNNSDQGSDLNIDLSYQQKNLSFSDDYVSGMISKVVKTDSVSDDIYYIDFSKRAVIKYNEATSDIQEITNIGRGPGEFLRPIYIAGTNGKNTLAISDVATTSIEIISTKGDHVKTIQHKFGGKKFILSDSLIYLHGVLDSLVQVINFEGESIRGLISPPKAYQLKSRYLAGGGIAKIGDLIFVIGSIEPRIYYFNKNDFSTYSTIEPKSWEKFQENFNEEEILSKRGTELIRDRNSYAIFLDILPLKIDDKDFITVIYSKSGKEYINIFTISGELVFDQQVKFQIVGSHNNILYAFDPDKINSNPLKKLEFKL